MQHVVLPLKRCMDLHQFFPCGGGAFCDTHVTTVEFLLLLASDVGGPWHFDIFQSLTVSTCFNHKTIGDTSRHSEVLDLCHQGTATSTVGDLCWKVAGTECLGTSDVQRGGQKRRSTKNINTRNCQATTWQSFDSPQA